MGTFTGGHGLLDNPRDGEWLQLGDIKTLSITIPKVSAKFRVRV